MEMGVCSTMISDLPCSSLYFRYYCNCSDGYTGLHCEMDIDECASDPCQNGAECTDGQGTYQCLCHPGWSGKNNTINETGTLLYLFFNHGVKSLCCLLADPRKIKFKGESSGKCSFYVKSPLRI